MLEIHTANAHKEPFVAAGPAGEHVSTGTLERKKEQETALKKTLRLQGSYQFKIKAVSRLMNQQGPCNY